MGGGFERVVLVLGGFLVGLAGGWCGGLVGWRWVVGVGGGLGGGGGGFLGWVWGVGGGGFGWGVGVGWVGFLVGSVLPTLGCGRLVPVPPSLYRLVLLWLRWML